MRKINILLLMTGLLTGLLGTDLCLAQEMKDRNLPPATPDGKAPAQPMNPMENMLLMQIMKDKSIVAMPDGGVTIIVANKIIRYDKDLNVAKEAEMDQDPLQQNRMGGFFPPPSMPGQDARSQSAVPTADGGVIVAAGTRLIKYDKDLNAVKKADIKIDTETLRKIMMSRMAPPPMARPGMQMGTGKPPQAAANAKPAEAKK